MGFIPNQTIYPRVTGGNQPRANRLVGPQDDPRAFDLSPSELDHHFPAQSQAGERTAYYTIALSPGLLPASAATILAIWLRRWLSSSCSSVVRLRAGRAGFFRARSLSSDPRRLGTEALRCMTIRGLGFQVCLRGRVSLLEQRKTKYVHHRQMAIAPLLKFLHPLISVPLSPQLSFLLPLTPKPLMSPSLLFATLGKLPIL